MKKIIYLLGVIVLFSACDDKNNELVTAETAKELPNVVEFTKMAEAIDNLNVSSKTSVEDQLVNYLDKEFSGDFKQEFQRMKRNGQTSLTAKGNDEVVDLDQQLDTAGFTPVQKEYVSKITGLYPLTESNSTVSDDETVKKIKLGLLGIRNEIVLESRLDDTQKQQMFTYIDMQYVTLDSVINYVEKTVASSTGKWKISLKKIINIVVSIVITTVVVAVLVAVRAGTDAGALLGGAIGFLSGTIAAVKNRCIKVCGTGYCDTAWNDCDTSRLETEFVPKLD